MILQKIIFMKTTFSPRTKIQHAGMKSKGPKQLIAVHWHHLEELDLADLVVLGQARPHTVFEEAQLVFGYLKTNYIVLELSYILIAFGKTKNNHSKFGIITEKFLSNS